MPTTTHPKDLKEQRLLKSLSDLTLECYQLSSELYQIEASRQRIESYGYDTKEGKDLMEDLYRLQGRLHALNARLVNVAGAIKDR